MPSLNMLIWRRRVGAWGMTTVACTLVVVGLLTAQESQKVPLRGKARKVIGEAIESQLIDSSQNGKRSWGPEQVEGPPDVTAAGSSSQAWASRTADEQIEWLVCEYAAPVKARAVVVYENAFPGALSKVSAFNSKEDEVIAWEGDDPTPSTKTRGISVIPIKLTFPVSRIRVTINSPAVSGWNEIDAVGLEDSDGTIHWAKHVEASSSYATPRNSVATSSKPAYSAAQAVGAPDTPRPGDQATAWCPATDGGQPDWLECRYKTAQDTAEIVVHETLSPGGITKIDVFDDEGRELTAWEGVDPTPRDQAWGVSVFPIRVGFRIKRIKLYLNSPERAGYHEIDAVGLRDAVGETQWAAEADASSFWGQQTMTSAKMRAMPAAAPSHKNLLDLQNEVKMLRKQMDELRTQFQELKNLRKE